MYPFVIAAQWIIAVSVAGVWILQLDVIEGEFREYGLPSLVQNLVGATKISLATLLVAGTWYPSLVLLPALFMAFLMLCAQFFHLKAKHRMRKFLPSLALLLLSVFVAAGASGLF